MVSTTTDNEVRKEAARWAEKLAGSDLSATEREEFQRWLMADEAHQREFRAHNFVLNLARDLPEESRGELLALAQQGARERAPRRRAWIAALAASLLLALGVAGWFVYQSETPVTAHVTPAGAIRDVTLPEASRT
jgi:transmembrane sensor